ncbi:18851_t:CDS:2 [Funneliformis geosporum]|nr:18851_t:CDS:2 [Funneliformis geosporum]
MVKAQEFIERKFYKHVNEIISLKDDLEGHLDLSEYPNLTKIDFGYNSRLTSLKLTHSNRITWMSLPDTGIDNFNFMAETPNIHTICLPITEGVSNYDYIAKALREKNPNSTRSRNNDNSQRIKELEQLFAIVQEENQSLQGQIQQKQQDISDQQSQINELSNISFPNNPYNFIKLKQDISRLKIQELAPQVRNESTKLVELITKAKSKAGNFSSIVDLTLETQKQIVKNNETPQQYILSGKMEAYQTILSSNLVDEELQNILNKQTEVLDLEEHLESLRQNLNK